jgi:hypothetical protein
MRRTDPHATTTRVPTSARPTSRAFVSRMAPDDTTSIGADRPDAAKPTHR